MPDFQNIAGMLGGLILNFQAADIAQKGADYQASTYRIGGDIAATGALLSAGGYRASAQAVQGAAAFNLGIDDLNTQRQLDAVSRQYQRTISSQIAQAASSGISVTGRSAILLRNEAADSFGNQFIDLKIDAENKRRSVIYESNVKQTQLENQARAEEYQAAAARVTAANQAQEAAYQGKIASSQAEGKAIRSIPTLLSALVE
jgi:murein L,D-transpeptidase YcbB/YkuD